MELRWLSLPGCSWFPACGNPTSVTQDQFTIQATGREVVLSNTASQSTFYLVVERETAALIDFATCVGQPQCQCRPRFEREIPYGEITGYHAGSKEVVYGGEPCRAQRVYALTA